MGTVKTEARKVGIKKITTHLTERVCSSPTGFLFCKVHETAWCDHIESLIRKREDADAIWHEYKTYNIRRVMVPILPNNWSIYGLVVLEECDGEVLKAYLRNGFTEWSDRTTKGRDVEEPVVGEFIGLFCKGDGRLALRQMILDWLLPQGITTPTRCTSMRHTAAAEYKACQEIEKDQRAQMAHAWCLRWYNKCAHCTLLEGPESQFDDDLIPTV